MHTSYIKANGGSLLIYRSYITLPEFKLASNSQLERNLSKQVEIYKMASGAETGYKVIFFFTADEHARVLKILLGLGLENSPHVILVDARNDNKPTGSKA